MANLASFWKSEACGQTVLQCNQLLLIGQKFVENAKIEKLKCDIFWWFSNNVLCIVAHTSSRPQKINIIRATLHHYLTVHENDPKCCILNFGIFRQFLSFQSYLSGNTVWQQYSGDFGIFNQYLSIQNININVECDFFCECDFFSLIFATVLIRKKCSPSEKSRFFGLFFGTLHPQFMISSFGGKLQNDGCMSAPSWVFIS